MTPEDRETVRKWAEGAGSRASVTLAAGKSPRGAAMREFADELAALCPAVTVKKDDEEEHGPALRVRGNILFQSVPGGRELPPFLAALSGKEAFTASIPEPLIQRAAAIALPSLFSVFVLPACPHCPKTVEKMLALAFASNNMHVRVIDAELFPEKAAAEEVRAAPTVVFDGRFRWTGSLDPEEVVAVAENRDPAALSAETLMALIADGAAPKLAEMMAEAGKLFPAFFETLAHDKWPVRLGAMVAFEYLAESAPGLAADAADTLVSLFDNAPDPVRGDILHTLALTGRADLSPWLRKVAEGPYGEDVREAAEEALGELETKG
ncbi:MAG: thioredoxin family protein [Thermodesulfobacteriota bacterium]